MRPDPAPVTLIALACAIEILSLTSLAAFPSLIPTFRAEWGIGNTAAGWIGGVYFGGLMASVAVFTALTDRIDARAVLLGGLGIATLASLGFGLTATGAWSGGFWRLLQGIGMGATYMPGLKLLTDLLPVRARSRGTAFYTATYYLAAGLSYLLAIELSARLGWAWTFSLIAIGPLIGLGLALLFPPAPPLPGRPTPGARLLDYRPLFANRPAIGFALLYGLHNYELMAFSTWIVPLLLFAHGTQAPGAFGLGWDLGLIAALIPIVALPASLGGNELAQRIGRVRVIVAVIGVSALVGLGLGLSVAGPFALVVALAFAQSALTGADSATLTAGVVQVAEARTKGATMSLYSIVGFAGGFIGPVIFGGALDLAGGHAAPGAWLAAFASIALPLLVGAPLLGRWIARADAR